MPHVKTNDGIQIYYRVEGHGKPIVLNHAWTQSSLNFNKMVKKEFVHEYQRQIKNSSFFCLKEKVVTCQC